MTYRGIACCLALLLAAAGALAQSSDEAPAPAYDKLLQVPVSALEFSQPLTVHADLYTGELFVADVRRNLVAVFDERGLFRFAIRGGAMFRSPLDLATYPDGRILVLGYTDSGLSLVRLDFDGRHPETIPVTGLPEGIAEPTLRSIALNADGSRLYLLDEANHMLWIADAGGAVTGSVDLAEGYDADERRDQILTRVDIYGSTVLVPLPMEGSVHLFDLDGRSLGTVGYKGGAACENSFPVAAALTEDGRLVVLDQQKALMVIWRRKDNRCMGEISGIGAAPGRLYRPADLALDGDGRAFVGQGFEGRVQRFAGFTMAAGSAVARELRE